MDISRKQQLSWAIGTVLGIIIIVFIWWLIAHHRTKSPVVGMEEATTTAQSVAMEKETPRSHTTPTTTSNEASVSVDDQNAGNTVAIASVSIPKRGWVAIEDTKNWTLGAERIEAGTSSTTVTLLRNTKAGEAYKAVLYIDNGNGAFDLHGDTMLVGVDGMPVAMSFLAK